MDLMVLKTILKLLAYRFFIPWTKNFLKVLAYDFNGPGFKDFDGPSKKYFRKCV